MSFAQMYVFSCPIVLKFCTEHGSYSAVLCAKFQNDWTTHMNYRWTGFYEIRSSIWDKFSKALWTIYMALGINMGWLDCFTVSLHSPSGKQFVWGIVTMTLLNWSCEHTMHYTFIKNPLQMMHPQSILDQPITQVASPLTSPLGALSHTHRSPCWDCATVYGLATSWRGVV